MEDKKFEMKLDFQNSSTEDKSLIFRFNSSETWVIDHARNKLLIFEFDSFRTKALFGNFDEAEIATNRSILSFAKNSRMTVTGNNECLTITLNTDKTVIGEREFKSRETLKNFIADRQKKSWLN